MSHFLNIALSLFHRLFPVVPFAGEDKTNISLDSRKGLISSAGFQKKFHPLPWMDGWMEPLMSLKSGVRVKFLSSGVMSTILTCFRAQITIRS